MSSRLRTVGLDLGLVAVLVAAMLVELRLAEGPDTEVTPAAVTVVLLAALPTLLRRRNPALALALCTAALVGLMFVIDIYQTVPFASMVCGYSLALVASRRQIVVAAAALVPVVLFCVLYFGDRGLIDFEVLKNLAFVAVPIILARAVRNRRDYLAALVDRAETAERTREEEALRRVGEERLRIARDVHDVVAHAMVAINVQAGVGAHLLDRDPARARGALEDIKKVSGEALTDLRATLGMLHSADETAEPPVLPVPGLTELDELALRLRSAGVDVDLDVSPALATLPASVAATGFRIVQEALTNVVRHAGGACVRVRVVTEDGQVLIDVEDDGSDQASTARDAAPAGTGHGVRGMTERARAAGGTLEAGPRAEGGWRVRARLPVGPVGPAGSVEPSEPLVPTP